MSAPSHRIEMFTLTHAQLMDGQTSFIEAALATSAPDDLDILGVSNASITPNSSDWSNPGDDQTMSYWSWLDDADIAVEAGYISFPMLANLTGRPEESSTVSGPGGSRLMLGMDLWHEASLNTAPKPMLIRTIAKDEDGVVGDAVVGLYKVQPGPITLTGPQIKTGVRFNLNGKCLFSRKDEMGNLFADGKKRVGKLLAFFPV